MPNFFETLGRGMASSFWKGSKYATKPFWGNWPGRIAAGGIVGGIYGGATSESNTSTGTFKDTLAGAIGGLGLVGGAYGAGKLGWAGLKKLGSGKGLRGLAKGVGRLGMSGARLGWKAAKPALSYTARHPVNVAVGAAAIGGLGAIGYNMYEGLSGTGANNPEDMMYYSGRQQLMDSTAGLVQGLHSNRH